MLEQQYDGDLIHEKFESQFPVCQKMVTVLLLIDLGLDELWNCAVWYTFLYREA